jgi:hypothetical protein
MNAVPEDVKADYESNRDLVRIFYGLEGLLLSSFSIIPHQLKKVRRLCKQDRGRLSESTRALETMKSELASFKLRFSELAVCLNTAIGEQGRSSRVLNDRLARLESGAEVFAAHVLEGK